MNQTVYVIWLEQVGKVILKESKEGSIYLSGHNTPSNQLMYGSHCNRNWLAIRKYLYPVNKYMYKVCNFYFTTVSINIQWLDIYLSFNSVTSVVY